MSIETMTKLATTTLSANTASVTFSSIPQGYTDLKVLISGRTTGTSGRGYIVFSFNSSTGVYDRIWAAGYDGTQTTSARTTSETYGFFGTVPDANATASTFGNAQFYITNYTSNNLKSYTIDAVAENNSTGTYMLTLVAGSWDNTSALTSITFYAVGDGSLSSPTGSFLTHSTFTLYGVKAARTAVGNSIKAVGGNISFDGTYVVHTFNTSGTFTPSDSLRVDYLVVAGGGGGGRYYAGAGGAGGMRSTVGATGGGGSLESALSLTAGTSYTVTVGAGGVASTGLTGGAGSNSVFSTITSTGGGGGGGANGGSNTPGQTGGSGGGGNRDASTAGGAATASPVQGFAGGTGNTGGSLTGGGGGGASEAGNTDGNGYGGDGAITSISGSSVTYAGGGSGGTATGSTLPAGDGGGGTGGSTAVQATNGTANTGGGAGGGGTASPYEGGAGGSGIVIVRYRAVV